MSERKNRYIVGFTIEAPDVDTAKDRFWEKIHYDTPTWDATEAEIKFVEGPLIYSRKTSEKRSQE